MITANSKAIVENGSKETKQVSLKLAFERYVGESVETKMQQIFMPTYGSLENQGANLWLRLFHCQLKEMTPMFYIKGDIQETLGYDFAQLTLEGVLQEQKIAEEESLTALFIEENQEAKDKLKEQSNQAIVSLEKQETFREEGGFVLHEEKLAYLDMESFADYDDFLKNFYTVDKSTVAGKELLNVETLSSADMTLEKEAEGPHVLIYHTHSQEAYADSVPGDSNTSIVGVGEYLAKVLAETYGYQVLHHKGIYDLPSRDDAYSKALPEIEKILDENPQIQVVIDLHRDAVEENTRLVMELDGRPTARFMFFNGLSRTKKTGNISYLQNENLEDNLAFSFQLQKAAVEYYPGLTRKIYLKAYRYNMHLRPKNLLVELGAQNNTVEEAMNAIDPLAHILDMVLSGQG